MDWETHLILAGKLLKSCDLSIGGCIYSLLPTIDIEPLAFHRQYAHVLINQTLVIDAAAEIYGTPEFKETNFSALIKKIGGKLEALIKNQQKVEKGGASRIEKRLARDRVYFYKRVAETSEQFVKEELREAVRILGKQVEDVSTDKVTAAVSIVSHTYFDTFNNPVSAFYPYSPNYAAHFSFWEEIDYLNFKETFYEAENIARFRESMGDSSVWIANVDPTSERDPVIRERIEKEMGKPYNPRAVVKAMIERLGDLAPGIRYEAVDRAVRDFLAYMGCKEIVHCDRERLFLLNVEREIKRLIYEKYGKRR
jgi:hypothetical protein